MLSRAIRIALGFQLCDVGLAFINDFLEHFDHAWIVSQRHDPSDLHYAPTHTGDHFVGHA